MVLWGSKGPAPPCLTLSSINMSDRKFQPGGKFCQDPSPRSAMTTQWVTTQLAQERVSNREEDRRRQRDMERIRDKSRSSDLDPRERNYQKDRATAPRWQEGEREWLEREVRQGDDRNKHVRALLNVQKYIEREMERGIMKGETFPRMANSHADHGRRKMSAAANDEERGERRKRDRQRPTETGDWERERERERPRDRLRERDRDDIHRRAMDEGKSSGRRPVEQEKLRQRERSQPELDSSVPGKRGEMGDLRDKRERYAARNRENLNPDMRKKEGRSLSPYIQRDREIDSDQREKEKAQKSGGRRDTRSEGDSEERELGRERARDCEKEHSKSEGENNDKRMWEGERDRQGNKEDHVQRYRDRDRERGADRPRRRGMEKDGQRYGDADRREVERGKRRERGEGLNEDRAWLKDKGDRYREYKQRKYRQAKEAELSWDETTGRSSQSPGMPPRALSSGEQVSDMAGEMIYRRLRDGYEERESSRDNAEEQRDPERAADRSKIKQKRSQWHESDKGEVTVSMPGQRRMWLEPQRYKNSKEHISDRERHKRQNERRREVERTMESQEREGWQIKQDPDECYSNRGTHKERSEYRGHIGRDTEGVSVDGDDMDEVPKDTDNERREHLSDSNGWTEGSLQNDAEGENAAEEGDKEEQSGSDYFTNVGSETLKRSRTLSSEDYVTLSSSIEVDEEDRENDKDEDFQDCQESWGSTYYASSPIGSQKCGRHKATDEEWTTGKEERVNEEEQDNQPKYVFCVIGQTFKPSQVDQVGESERHHPELEKCNHCSDDAMKQPQDDLCLMLSRNKDHLITSNQNKEDATEQNTSKEKRSASATGEPTEDDISYLTSSAHQDTETGEETRIKVDYSCAEGEIKGDSQTERLLIQWREKNKEVGEKQRDQPSPLPSNPYAEVRSEVNFVQVLEEINAAILGGPEKEAAQTQMGKAWTMCDEPKRHSQAPHLKWAKNVVRDILGHSEEESMDDSEVPGIKESGTVIKSGTREEELAQGTKEIPFITVTTEQHSDPELQEDNSLEELRGTQQSQGGTHSEQDAAMHDDTLAHTHADTLLNTGGKQGDSIDKEAEPSGHLPLEKTDVELQATCEAGAEVLVSMTANERSRPKDSEMYLTASNTLYKPNSCPILNCDSASETLAAVREGKLQEAEDRMGDSGEEIQEEEPEGWGIVAEVPKTKEVVAERDIEAGDLTNTSNSQDTGARARMLRRGIRETGERSNDEPVEEGEEEGAGRDRRTRIFSTSDDDEDWSKSWGGSDVKNIFNTFMRQKRKSKFFKRAQLYQQYNEAAQNMEILSQSGSDAHRAQFYQHEAMQNWSHSGSKDSSPAASPPPARRPLPPLPSVLHPHSVFHTSSFTSVKSLPLPEPPKNDGRPPSPRLSVSFTQSPTLWRDLPGVRDNCELVEFTEDQRRLQEVQFEVLTSEASYCRSLDIVVEHFVKSKQLGALLNSQDRSWLFSRLTDVRAISHSFLLKLEERVEEDIMHFSVCDIIVQHCPRFRKVYVPYLTNQSYQDATYQRLMNENPGFKRIVEKLERNPVCERLPFRSFLTLPFQRITRIKLLVQNIVKRTTPGTAEATQAIKAMKLLEKVIQESNDSISQMKNIESLVSLNAKVDFECKTLPLVSQSRRMIREGPVTELIDCSLKDTERNAYLHLFNDFLLVSLQKEGGRFTVIEHSPMSELRVENCRIKLHTLQKNLFRLHMPHKSLLLRTETQSDKLRWISALSRPHPVIDFSAAQDLPQMQCIRAFVAQQPDELSLDKADIILVHEKIDHWIEGTRLPDRHRGWVPESNLETISNARAKERNLSDALRLTTATAAV